MPFDARAIHAALINGTHTDGCVRVQATPEVVRSFVSFDRHKRLLWQSAERTDDEKLRKQRERYYLFDNDWEKDGYFVISACDHSLLIDTIGAQAKLQPS